MASSLTSEAPAKFSERIRHATRSAHGNAEHATFMADLMAGHVEAARFASYTAQLYFIYRALDEAETLAVADPAARAFVHPGLSRVSALEEDLRFFLGDRWDQRVAPAPVTAEYCDRLRAIGAEWPAGFVAHHYTRYMGDLSGGQFIRKAIANRYGWCEGVGASFYAFDAIGDLDVFKNAYRARLDAAPWDAEEQQRIVKEILLAYDLNTRLLAAI